MKWTVERSGNVTLYHYHNHENRLTEIIVTPENLYITVPPGFKISREELARLLSPSRRSGV